MRVRSFAALAAATLLATAGSASAAVVQLDYSFTADAGGPVDPINGSFVADYDTVSGVYSLESIDLTIGPTTFTPSNTALTPMTAIPSFLNLSGTFDGPSIIEGSITGYSNFSLNFDPSPPFTYAVLPFIYTVGGQSGIWTGPVTMQLAGVPEPETWMLAIAGFFGTGALLRRRRDALLTREVAA